MCLKVFIILNGEFEIVKRVTSKKTEDESLIKFLGSEQSHSAVLISPTDKSKNFTLPKADNIHHQKISILGKGNMVGEDDAAQMRNYTTTCKCVSQSGTLLWIKTSEFHLRVKTNDETWKYIEKSSKDKEHQVFSQVLKSNKIIKDNDVVTKRLCKQDES